MGSGSWRQQQPLAWVGGGGVAAGWQVRDGFWRQSLGLPRYVVLDRELSLPSVKGL